MIKSHFSVEEDPGAAHRQKGKQGKMLFVGDCWYRRGGIRRAFDGLTSLRLKRMHCLRLWRTLYERLKKKKKLKKHSSFSVWIGGDFNG